MRRWATNAVYGAGHGNLTGEDTKADPGRANAGNGFVPGWLPAQHINHQLHEQSQALANAQRKAAMQVESVSNLTTPFACAVTWQYDINCAMVIDDTNTSHVGDPAIAQNVSSVSSFHDVRAIAQDRPSGRIVSVGENTNKARYSDNNGTSWTTAVTQPAGNVANVVSLARDSDGGGDFVGVPTTATNLVYLTTDNGLNWSSVATNNDTDRGVARINGTSSAGVVTCSGNRYETTELSASTYTTWTDRGLVPDNANITAYGWISGGPNYRAYFAAHYTDELRVYELSQTDASWTLASTIPHTPTPANVQIHVDLPTGTWYVVVYDTSNANVYVYVSHNEGYSWQGPYVEAGIYLDLHSIRPAGGRLYHKSGSLWYRTAVASPRAAV